MIKVSGHIVVPEGESLTIEEGVQVIFDDAGVGANHAPIEFTVDGNLYCEGTAENPVRLTVAEEDQSLYWNDDKEIVDTFVLKTIKRFEEKNGANQELLPEFKDEEDQEFARRLFRRAILNCDYYRHLISENTRNWDLDRVAFMDVVIMQCALAEILSFPNIPVSVSLNEYVDIAKVYSTAKSGSFVNGTLDGIVNQLKKEGKLTKN